MPEKILVTYSTQTGSTAGVAEFIGKSLKEAGRIVDVLPVNMISDLSDYKAVIVGSPIQAQQWLPDAMQFIASNKEMLISKPVSIFSVCMTLAMPNGEKYRAGVIKWLDPVRKIVRPVDEGYFAGVLDISKVPDFRDRIKFRLSVFLGFWKQGDHRNWKAIDIWVKNLKLLSVV